MSVLFHTWRNESRPAWQCVGTGSNSLLMTEWRASTEIRGPSTRESSSMLRDKSTEEPVG